MHSKILNEQGSTLVELIVALALFMIMLSTLFVFSLEGIVSVERSKYYKQALAYELEAENYLLYIAESDFSKLNLNRSGFLTTNNNIAMLGEGSIEEIGDFKRYVDFVSVGAKKKYADINIELSVVGQKPISLSRRLILVDRN